MAITPLQSTEYDLNLLLCTEKKHFYPLYGHTDPMGPIVWPPFPNRWRLTQESGGGRAKLQTEAVSL